MARTVAIGVQDFEKLMEQGSFYVDKTDFIREWWESGDEVTLITRPRRFGKTLNMSMLECFFSNKFAGKSEIFEGLNVWEHEEMRSLQGSFPVIFMTFASVKDNNFPDAVKRIRSQLESLYDRLGFLHEWKEESDISELIQRLSGLLYKRDGKKVIILLDEYDTPLSEAYVFGFYDEMVQFMRPFFNCAFKTNPYLDRAVMTGITRVSRESLFSDMNNLKVVSTTTPKYETAFGFTEEEVFAALDEQGYTDKEQVKRWYDGFIFGRETDIYNPWSITNYLDNNGILDTYWANTSSNSLAGKLIREGDVQIKQDMEDLLSGKSIKTEMDEQIVFGELKGSVGAVWSLLTATGYLKVVEHSRLRDYELTLTNLEVKEMFRNLVAGWFKGEGDSYNRFIKAMISGNLKEMNIYMNRILTHTFSYFDTGGNEPERFYHGFVLGLLSDLASSDSSFSLRSNRESGYGRYDVMLIPKDAAKDKGIILEFKVYEPDEEANLEETVQAALKQIEEKNYEAELVAAGVPADRIYKYGFAFEGKRVLIK